LRYRTAVVSGVGVVACLAVLATGCSSSAKPKTTPTSTVTVTSTIPPPTTLPSKQVVAAVKKFFTSKLGRDLLTFEKLTPRLVEAPTLKHAQCQPVIQELGKIGSPDYFLAATTHIPESALSIAFQHDVGAKRLYLAACNTTVPLPFDAGATIKPFQDALRTEIAKYGFTI
jgi:hypothetical protein